MSSSLFNRHSSPWYTPLGAATVHTDSAALVAELLRMREVSHGGALGTTFVPGGGRIDGGLTIQRTSYSTTVYHVTSSTPRVPVILHEWGPDTPYTQNSTGTGPEQLAARCAAGVPIPSGAAAAAGTDQHMVIVDDDTHEMWEFWHLRLNYNWGAGVVSGWSANWGGYMASHLASQGRYETRDYPRQFGAWGSTATSLPLAAGLILDEELVAGVIPHAIHVVLPDPLNQAAWPAQRADGAGSVIREGMRFRIKASVDVSTYVAASGGSTAVMQTIGRAGQTYGFVIDDKSDVGNAIGIRAEYLHGGTGMASLGSFGTLTMKNFPTSDFEFVDVNYRAPYTAGNTSGEVWGIAA